MGKRDRKDPCSEDSDQLFSEKVYENYKVMMVQTALGFVGMSDAEDIVSTVIEKLFNKKKVLQGMYGKAELVFYIKQTVRNHCINHLKREKRRKDIIVDCQLEDVPELTTEELRVVEEKVIGKERDSEMRQYIERLPEKYRILMEGKYLENLSDDELASQLGCKKSSLRSMLTRAKRKLVALMEEGDFDDVVKR